MNFNLCQIQIAYAQNEIQTAKAFAHSRIKKYPTAPFVSTKNILIFKDKLKSYLIFLSTVHFSNLRIEKFRTEHESSFPCGDCAHRARVVSLKPFFNKFQKISDSKNVSNRKYYAFIRILTDLIYSS